MKPTRRQARADALQILYQLDLNQGLKPNHALLYFENFYSGNKETDPFTKLLVLGTVEHLAILDTKIEAFSENWRVDRMAAVDRNILRLGAYELHFCDDVPATVTINEMVELAKQFGAETSQAFVNAILDKMKTSVNRPEKAP